MAALCCLCLTGCSGSDAANETSTESGPPPQLVQWNLGAKGVFETAFTDSVLTAELAQPVATRIGAWARRFLAANGTQYLFGPADGGYVNQGRLVLDTHHDCVSLMYRCSELGRAGSAVDALEIALRTRFAGALADSLIDEAGRVNYDRPEHLDYSLDMIRSGHWGVDITGELSGSLSDAAGSSRYAPGSFDYVPTAALRGDELAEGDIAWLVLDPAHPTGKKLREKYGLVIGHLGIVVLRDGEPWLVHAGSSPLPGYYEEGGVVTAPVKIYLERVEKFAGLMVTRFR